MKNKLLAGICAILFLAALAGCNSETEETPPALDWGKIVDYDKDDVTQVLGTATAALDGTGGRYKNTVLGNFIMDGIAEYARHASGEKIDFALHNGQNLAGGGSTVGSVPHPPLSLPAGELANSAITGLIGGDALWVGTYTGAEIKEIIEIFVNSAFASGSIPSSGSGWKSNCAVMVSKGVSYDITPDSDSALPPHAANIKLNGTLVQDDTTYRVALGALIAGKPGTGGSANFVSYGSDKTELSTPLNQAVAMYVLAKGTINPSDYPVGRYTGEVPSLYP